MIADHPEDPPSSFVSSWDVLGEAEHSSHFTATVTGSHGALKRHTFHPTRVIVLSELPTRRKEYFYKLLLSNRAKFTSDGHGKFVANVRLMGPDVKKSEIASISMKDRRCAAIFLKRILNSNAYNFLQSSPKRS